MPTIAEYTIDIINLFQPQLMYKIIIAPTAITNVPNTEGSITLRQYWTIGKLNIRFEKYNTSVKNLPH